MTKYIMADPQLSKSLYPKIQLQTKRPLHISTFTKGTNRLVNQTLQKFRFGMATNSG